MISRHTTPILYPALLAVVSAAAWSGACAQTKAVSAATPSTFIGNMGSNAQVVGEPLHLLVGRSMFVNTENRLRRVYVSNPDVLDSFTSSPHQIVITAKTAGVSTVVLWDESGQSRAYLVNCDVDVADLHKVLKDAFPNDDIRVEGHGDQVALAGTVDSNDAAAAATKLAGLYSKDVANSLQVESIHTPQVRLKVRVVEIDRSRATQLGFNLFGPGSNTFSSTTGQFGTITVAPSAAPGGTGTGLLALEGLLNLFYYNNNLQLGAAIQALIDKQIVQILAEPTLTAVSGEKASFLSGGSFPYPMIEPGIGGVNTVTIVFKDYGVKVDFTPTVMQDGTISLKVAPEVSALDYTNEVVIDGYTLPAISTRRADTRVELKSGQSFAISGLLDNRTLDQMEKIPGIGDIPILGKLFQSKTTNHTQSELAVIVTPTIVDPITDNTLPLQPKMAIPFIENQKFDKEMSPKTPLPQPQPNPVPQDAPVHD